MIATLRGKILNKTGDAAIIECGGVGFNVLLTRRGIDKLGAVGNQAFVYIHMVVREDAMELFGFSKMNELNCFKLLTSVSGVGAKVGVAILSTLSAEQVAVAIASGDSKVLTMVPMSREQNKP